MFFSKFALASAVAALTASAAPLHLTPRAPPTSTGTAFRLVLKVTGADFPSDPVNNLEVSIAHTTPGSNRAVVAPSSSTVFYQNGTQAERDAWTASLINDTPSFPQGFVIDFEGSGGVTGGVFEASVNAGPGSQSVMVSPDSEPRAFIDRHGNSPSATGSFIVCADEKFGKVVNWHTLNDAPEGCVNVELVPECEALPALPAGATWTHDFVQEVRCYADVSAITEWTD